MVFGFLDFVVSQPENALLDVSLAESMLGGALASRLHLPAAQLRLVLLVFSLSFRLKKPTLPYPASPPGAADQFPYASVSLSWSADSPSINLS